MKTHFVNYIQVHLVKKNHEVTPRTLYLDTFFAISTSFQESCGTSSFSFSPFFFPSRRSYRTVQYRKVIYTPCLIRKNYKNQYKDTNFLLITLALRSLSAGVSVQMERSLFSGPDFFLKVRAPKPMCCSSGGSSVIHVSLVTTSGVSCLHRNTHKQSFKRHKED